MSASENSTPPSIEHNRWLRKLLFIISLCLSLGSGFYIGAYHELYVFHEADQFQVTMAPPHKVPIMTYLGSNDQGCIISTTETSLRAKFNDQFIVIKENQNVVLPFHPIQKPEELYE